MSRDFYGYGDHDGDQNVGGSPFLEDEHVNDEILALMADALLQDKFPLAPEDAMDHVDVCCDCKDKIMDVVLFMSNPMLVGVTDSPVTAPTGKNEPTLFAVEKPRRYSLFYSGKLAAVFMAMAVMVSAYFVFLSNPDVRLDDGNIIGFQSDATLQAPESLKSGEPVITARESATKKIGNRRQDVIKRDVLPPEAFRVNHNLERMTGSRVRSGGPTVTFPPDGWVKDGVLHFDWNPAPASSYTLKIVNNKNQVLYSFQVSGNSLVMDTPLADGLFYWKLENDHELLYVGKFFVGNPE